MHDVNGVDTDIYHVGASLKDLGRKWFAFPKLELEAVEILQKLKWSYAD